MTATTQPEANNLAIASLVLGVLAILGLGPITGIPALITGFMALKNPEGRGMAIAGLVMGGISLVLGLLIILFVVIIFGLAIMSADNLNSGSYQMEEPVEPIPYRQRA